MRLEQVVGTLGLDSTPFLSEELDGFVETFEVGKLRGTDLA